MTFKNLRYGLSSSVVLAAFIVQRTLLCGNRQHWADRDYYRRNRYLYCYISK